MYVKNLKSLVLRGVSVLRDGATVEARLGFGYPTVSQAPETPISMRPGSCREPNAEPKEWQPDANLAKDAHALRAGRSDSRTGVLVTTPTFRVGRAGRPWALGGTAPVAATRFDHYPVGFVAPGALNQPFAARRGQGA
jgi:hypothetical protein